MSIKSTYEPRDEISWAEWRMAVYKKDNYKCQNCRSEKLLEPHHIMPFYYFKNLRYEVSNGVTLCHDCHMKVERTRWNLGVLGNCKNFNSIIKKNGRFFRFNWLSNEWVETVKPRTKLVQIHTHDRNLDIMVLPMNGKESTR